MPLAPKYLESWHCNQDCLASQRQRFREQPSGAVRDSALSHPVPVARPHRTRPDPQQGSVGVEPALSPGSIPLPGTLQD